MVCGLQGMLDHVSVCLQEELSREQEHLMLMQVRSVLCILVDERGCFVFVHPLVDLL